MIQKGNSEINWNRMYVYILLHNSVLILLFYVLKLLFNQLGV